MKLSWKQIEPFIKNPDKAARVILVYGPDTGLMKERAKTMAMSVVADIHDPFNAVTLTGDSLAADPARLSDEAFAMSMMGGDRLIRIEDASDKITSLIKTYLERASAHSLIVLEAGDLGTKSSLRKLCENAGNAAAVPCYVEDERDVVKFLRGAFQDAGIMADQDAIAWLAMNIAGDRQKIRSEIEKIITYKNSDSAPLNLSDVQACCGEAGAQSLDDLVYFVAGNQSAKALKAYHQLLDDGVNFVVILRGLQNHFRRLHITRARIDDGEPADLAMKKLAPPVFFKQADLFKAQSTRWSLHNLNMVLGKLTDLEAQCKTTGAPADTLCAQAVLGISSMR